MEIIPSLTSIQVERELRERPRLSDVLSDESDHLPKYKVFRDSEGEFYEKERKEKEKQKGKKPPARVVEDRPKLYRQVKLTMKTGEVVQGQVSHVEKVKRNWFFVSNEKIKH